MGDQEVLAEVPALALAPALAHLVCDHEDLDLASFVVASVLDGFGWQELEYVLALPGPSVGAPYAAGKKLERLALDLEVVCEMEEVGEPALAWGAAQWALQCAFGVVHAS